MKFSFFSSTSYMGPAPSLSLWPMPPRFCDRETAGVSIARGLETCRRAEALGFDWVSLSEHHYATLTLTPSTTVMAGALSQTVKRAKIAVLGPIMPLSHPIRVAEELAELDHLTEGRLIVLFLQGTPNEHRAYETQSADTRALTQESIELILKAWTADEPFAWRGRHFDLPNVAVWPRPQQAPRPYVFGSGNNEDSARFAARQRIGMALSFMPLETAQQRVALYRREAEAAGWRPEPSDILYRGLGHLAETDAEAEREVKEAVEAKVAASHKLQAEGGVPATPGEPVAERAPIFSRPLFHGSPRRVREICRAFHEAGVGTLDIAFHWGVTTYEQQLRSMTLFAERVIPEARDW
ncbi:MAG TPA: LLM class flavin-dependent oxidoreductase [Stellaceae bacterium]|nr:LLM class flavin-dependent oxidoreductase [Stellaceae bacterium]